MANNKVPYLSEVIDLERDILPYRARHAFLTELTRRIFRKNKPSW